MDEQRMQNLILFLEEVIDDQSAPRNVKVQITEVINILKSDLDDSLKVHKVMQIFDELQDDTNIDQHTRTQLWSAVTVLESL
ncbi:MAG: UPF0147 family protein [Candidatus Woesearchaeota archaeon]